MKNVKLNINSVKLCAGKSLEFQDNNEMYYTGAKNLVNLIPRNNNILTRRPGSIYIDTLDSEVTKYIKFITIDFYKQTHLLEFTTGKIRVYIANKRGKSYGIIAEINSPYETKQDIDNISYTKDNINNSIIIFSLNIQPHILTKAYEFSDFSLTPMEFIDGPYEDINLTDTTLKPDKTSGNRVNIIASTELFSYRDVGLHLRIYDEKTKIWGWGIITNLISNTHIQVDIKKDLGGLNSTKYWRKGVFNKFRGYPTLGRIFNSRLYLANTTEKTSYIWVSCYNDYSNFAPTTNSAFNSLNDLSDNIIYNSAITFIFSEVKTISWLEVTFQYVVVGSEEGIFALMPLDLTKNLSPYNFTIQKITNNSTLKLLGSNDCHIFFLNHINSLSVLEFTYNFVTPSIIDNLLPVTIGSNKTVVNIAISSNYENIVTILFNTGEVAFITINKINKDFIYSFSEVVLGGNKSKVKCISGNSQYLYLLVERINNYKKVVTLEYINWLDLNLTLDEQASLQDLQYLDCKTISVYEAPINKIIINSNTTIAIIADYSYIGEFNLKDGSVNLSVPACSIIKGYNYNSYYESLDLSTISIINGWITYKKLFSLTLGVINSLGGTLKINSTAINKDLISLDLNNINKKFFTGYKTYNINYTYNNTLSISIIQNTPLPLNINFIGIEIIYS